MEEEVENVTMKIMTEIMGVAINELTAGMSVIEVIAVEAIEDMVEHVAPVVVVVVAVATETHLFGVREEIIGMTSNIVVHHPNLVILLLLFRRK